VELPAVGGKSSAGPVSETSDESVRSEASLSSPALNQAGREVTRGQETGELSDDEDKSTVLPCDEVLEDLLHIVNESLGRVDDDGPSPVPDSHPLPDYELDDDDNDDLISMVVSPKSEVPASTVVPASDDTQLTRIIDYCPEWSFVEVL